MNRLFTQSAKAGEIKKLFHSKGEIIIAKTIKIDGKKIIFPCFKIIKCKTKYTLYLLQTQEWLIKNKVLFISYCTPILLENMDDPKKPYASIPENYSREEEKEWLKEYKEIEKLKFNQTNTWGISDIWNVIIFRNLSFILVEKAIVKKFKFEENITHYDSLIGFLNKYNLKYKTEKLLYHHSDKKNHDIRLTFIYFNTNLVVVFDEFKNFATNVDLNIMYSNNILYNFLNIRNDTRMSLPYENKLSEKIFLDSINQPISIINLAHDNFHYVPKGILDKYKLYFGINNDLNLDTSDVIKKWANTNKLWLLLNDLIFPDKIWVRVAVSEDGKNSLVFHTGTKEFKSVKNKSYVGDLVTFKNKVFIQTVPSNEFRTNFTFSKKIETQN